MTDFALYQGLQRKSNIFETKAANRQMELQITSAIEQRSQQKLQEESEIDAKMQEFYSAVNEIDILQQDQERVGAAEKRYRADVVDLVKKYNGNLSHFMHGGGSGALERYKNNVMESEEVKTAIGNKMNYAQWAHAQANGLFVKDVGVDLPVMDEEGNVTKERRKVSMDEAYSLFEKGHIKQLPYDGSEKDIDVGPDMFQKIFKDPRNPYSQDTNVTPEDVYLWVRERGGSDDQAKAKMNKYTQYVNQGGTEWRYKSGDMMKYKLQQQQLSNMRQKSKMNKQAMSQNLTSSAVLDFQSRIRNAAPGQDVKLLPEEEKFFAQQFGFVFDQESGRYNTTRNLPAFDRSGSDNPNPKQYDLRDFTSFYPQGYHIGPKGEVMLKMKARTDPEMDTDKMPLYEAALGLEQVNDGAHLNNWEKVEDNWSFLGGNSVYEGDVYVPITDYYQSEYPQTYLNDQINVRQNAYMTPASAMRVNDDRTRYYSNLLNNTTGAIMSTTGANRDGALEMGYNWAMQNESGGGQLNPFAGGAQQTFSNQQE